VSAANGSASNNDYDSAAFPKTVTFTAGQGNGSTQTVSFDPTGDTLIEGDETVTLAIGNGPLLTGNGQTNQLITIKDADIANIAVVPGQTVSEDGGAQAVAVRLLTTGGSVLQSPLTVTLSASPSAGTEAADATFGVLGSFTFPAGAGNNTTSTAVSFTPNADTLVEGSELAQLAPAGSSLNGHLHRQRNHHLRQRQRYGFLPNGFIRHRRRRRLRSSRARPHDNARQHPGKRRHNHHQRHQRLGGKLRLRLRCISEIGGLSGRTGKCRHANRDL
jgi:hypothetical protein